MKKIIFYDLETTGRSAYWDQIIQIAAICTDEHLNVLDEMNIIGQLNSFSIPDPEALLVNKIPINCSITTKSLINRMFTPYPIIKISLISKLLMHIRIFIRKFCIRFKSWFSSF